MRIERRFWPLSEQSGRQCKHERRARGRTVGRDLCRLSIRLSHRYRSSSLSPPPSRSQWIKHSIGAGAPGRQWWYFWNSTVRLKYLTVYLPLPRFLLTRAHGRFAVSVLSFVKIIHEALLPFRYDEESIVSIFTLPPFSPRPFFEKTNPSIVLDVLVNLIWDDVNELPSCGGALEEFSFSSIGRCYKFFRNEFFFCTEIRIWFKYNIIRRMVEMEDSLVKYQGLKGGNKTAMRNWMRKSCLIFSLMKKIIFILLPWIWMKCTLFF